MKSATIHRLPTAATALPHAGARPFFEPAEENPDNPPQGLLASILAQGAHVLTSEGERERTQRNAITAFAVRCLSAALLYVSQIVLARWMGGNDYGIYVFVWTWVLVLGGLSTLGAGTALIRLVPSYQEGGDLDLLRGAIRAGRLVPLAFSTLVMAAGLLVLWLLGNRVSQPVLLPAFLALFCVPMVTLSTAHPAKFAEAVRAASASETLAPAGFGDMLGKREVFDVLPNDRVAVENFILSRARAVAEKV